MPKYTTVTTNTLTQCTLLLPNARTWPRAAGVDAAGGPTAHRDHRTYTVCAGAEIDEASDFAPFVGCNLVAGNILVFALGKVRRTNRHRHSRLRRGPARSSVTLPCVGYPCCSKVFWLRLLFGLS